MGNLDGVTLVGWILATVAVAGLYGAVTNETWLSVLMRVTDPSLPATKIRP